MNDGIIKDNGTSRLIRSVADFKEKYPTYDDFVSALVAGTLPLDILFNADGWSQQPDFLNKVNLLKDATATLFGFSSGAVPDDILNFLGQFNLYRWERRRVESGYDIVLGELAKVTTAYGNIHSTINYSDKVEIQDGSVKLVSPSSFSFYYYSYEQIAKVRGKYWTTNYGVEESKHVYFSPVGAQYGLEDEKGVYIYAQKVTAQYSEEIGDWVPLTSSDPEAYPKSGIQDGYEYRYLGKPFDNFLVPGVRAEIGSYKGSGKVGKSNPNSLTFNFLPKFVFVFNKNTAGTQGDYGSIFPVWLWTTAFSSCAYVNNDRLTLQRDAYGKVSGNTISWYYDSSTVQYQLNSSGYTYYYLALG